MNRASILRKIKACLRLASSSNPNEAAAALRQAQAMMIAHGISHAEAMDVGFVDVGTRCRGAMPTRSLCGLIGLVAGGFGARTIVLCTWHKTTVRFYGAGGAAEIAAYAFTVLRRQMDADRLKHVARVRKRGNREARGETFALYWVAALDHLFPEAAVPEDKRLAIDQVMSLQHPGSTSGSGRDLTKRGKVNDGDAWAGHQAGKSARLHRGVTAEQKSLEHLA